MSNIAIRVGGLGKRYRIGELQRYKALRDVLTNLLYAPFRGLKQISKFAFRNPKSKVKNPKSNNFIWALKDVSFEVKQGEVIGIIGRNGAGKSTLLKILSRITEPTEGYAKVRGRIGSLLEVGTGFHPELTGRENIYLNGSILGMKKAEIKRKFDEIVSFAEVEKFIDTPVKHYSSGMYVRLAFAVAAHLEPEILLVDEVLAVGDAAFQKKCLGKMGDVAKGGKTVLFVSHNMAAITSLCNKSILLDAGQIVSQGKTSDIVLIYYSQGIASPASFDNTSIGKLIGDDHASLVAGAVVDRNSKPCSEVDIGEPIRIVMKYKIDGANNTRYFPNFHFFSSDGTYAFASSPRSIDIAKPGIYEAECIIPDNFLNDGVYFVGLALTSFRLGGSNMKVHFYEKNALAFNVKDPIEGVLTRNGDYVGPIPGVLRPLLDWTIRRV